MLSTPTATTRRSRFSYSRSTTCRTRVCRSRVLVVHPEDDDAAISFLVFEIYDVPQMRGAPQTGRAHQSGILAAPFLVASARHCVCRIQRRSASSDRALTGEFSGSFPVARRVTACLVFRGRRTDDVEQCRFRSPKCCERRSPPMGTNGPFTVDTLISRECRTIDNVLDIVSIFSDDESTTARRSRSSRTTRARQVRRSTCSISCSPCSPRRRRRPFSFLVFEIHDVPHESSLISCSRSFTPMATTRRSRLSYPRFTTYRRCRARHRQDACLASRPPVSRRASRMLAVT